MTGVVTGEAVVLDVQPASYPGLIAGLLIDVAVQVSFLVILLVVIAMAGHLDFAALRAITLASTVLTLVGYPAIFETLSRGKTLGKLALGLRVVGDDGGPERFRQALVRALVGVVEIWMFPPIALISSMVSARGKRLGDVFAGTFVIQERVPRGPDLAPDLAVVPPPLAGWARALELSRLSDYTAEAAGSYLRRLHELAPAARDDLGLRLATAVAAQVTPPPPPGTPPVAYLSAVLAVRRQREQARLAALGLSSPGRPPPGRPPPGPASTASPQPATTAADAHPDAAAGPQPATPAADAHPDAAAGDAVQQAGPEPRPFFAPPA